MICLNEIRSTFVFEVVGSDIPLGGDFVIFVCMHLFNVSSFKQKNLKLYLGITHRSYSEKTKTWLFDCIIYEI
jgi:hypothetical protein